MRQETKPAERQSGVRTDLLALGPSPALPGCLSLLETSLRRRVRLCSFQTSLLFSPPSAPLSVLRHVDGPPGWDGRAPVRDAEHLHGLPLWSPFAVTVQHGRVHPLPGRICGRARGDPERVNPVNAGRLCRLSHLHFEAQVLHIMNTNKGAETI